MENTETHTISAAPAGKSHDDPASWPRDARAGIRAGLLAAAPVAVGIVPFGITCGVMGLVAKLTAFETVAMSFVVFAGAAQFVAITMIGAGAAGFGVVVFTTLLLNLRHLLMGASLGPYLLGQPRWLQRVLSFMLTDESYALMTDRIEKAGYHPGYHLGVSLAIYFVWGLATLAGVLVGSYIPDPLSWGIDFAMPAIFMALLLPRLKDWTTAAVAVTAAVAALGGMLLLPGKWYMIIACVLASVVGGILDRGEVQDAD